MKYVYTAVFTPEPGDNNKNLLSVYFPDLPTCHTCGDDLSDALEMAKDVLCLHLYRMEEGDGGLLLPPDPTPPQNIKVEDGSFISAIAVDTNYYRKFYIDRQSS